MNLDNIMTIIQHTILILCIILLSILTYKTAFASESIPDDCEKSFPKVQSQVSSRPSCDTSMITLIQNHQRQHHQDLIQRMHEQRYNVFVKRLGWDIPVVDGNKDIDQYDVPEAIYIVKHELDGDVSGGARLLPTVGNYMLQDTFAHLMDDPTLIPSSPNVWEISRFFSNPSSHNKSLKFIRKETAKLFIAINEFALSWNLARLVAVTDISIEKTLEDIGVSYRRITTPKKIQDSIVTVVELDVSEDILMRMRRRTQILKPVAYLPLPFVVDQRGTAQSFSKYTQLSSKL